MTTEAKSEIKLYQLLALRGAVKLESKGLKHSSGRSMTAQARREFNLKRNVPRETVIELINQKIEEIKKETSK